MLRLRALAPSFRDRVAGVAMVTSLAALALAFAAFLAYAWTSEHHGLKDRRTAMAEVVAANLSASLVFQDPSSAGETLKSLAAVPDIRGARLYDAQGRPFAVHGAPGETAPTGAATTQARYGDDLLTVSTPVRVDHDRVGELVLVSETSALNRTLGGAGLIALFAFLLAALAARLAAWWLARRVIAPVERLSAAMAQVRESGQLDGHVERSGDAELAALADQFNALLRQLQANDDARRASLADLVRARDAAEAANVAKSQFLANMSHEIRTPLNGVLGMTQVMEREPLSDDQRRRLTVIRESGESLLTVLNDVLDISKIEAGKLELVEEDFDLADVVGATFASFGAVAATKSLVFELDVAPEAEGRWRGDPSRLRQVIANLVSNALKFTDAGAVRVSVAVEGPETVIAVADTGVGVPAAKLDQLFQKFSQVDGSATRRFGGTGLGLAICRELAQLMGGVIGVESVEGQGSRFTLRLPLRRVTTPAVEVCTPPPTAETDPDAPLRILAAEDNAVNQLVLKSLLEPLRPTLVVVGDGRAAVEAWRDGAFDLVLMDVQMPVMDGVEAARAIRAAEAETGRARTPILALSANAMTHQVQAYLDAGMCGHVAKPIEIERLYDAISALLTTPQDPAAPLAASA